MKLPVHLVIVTAIVATTVLVPTAASAQAAVGRRAYQGLFGGDGYDSRYRNSLEFGFAVTEAYDDDAPGEFFGNPGDALVSGYSTVLEGSGEYRWKGQRVEIGASAHSVMRYFNIDDTLRSSNHVAAVGLSAELTRSSTLFFNQSAIYSPSYLYGLFPLAPTIDPGEAPPVSSNYQVIDIASYSYNSDLSFTQRLSARNAVRASVNYNHTDFPDDQSIYFDLVSHGFRSDFTRDFSRRLSMVAGYRFQAGDYSASPDTTEHGIEAGLDYTRPISATRSALIGFRIGASNLEGAQVETPTGTTTENYTLMSATVNGGFQFGRSWRADATFRRGIDYVPGFPDPIVTDGFTTQVTGAFTERLYLTTSLAYSTGDSALFDQSFPFDTYTAQTRLHIALNNTIACSVEYIYYQYNFAEATTLPEGVPSSLERNGLRAGLTVWIPAFRR